MFPSVVTSRAEHAVAAAVTCLLQESPHGAELDAANPHLASGAHLCGGLERFVPEVLGWTCPGWEGEGLDGVDLILASRIGDHRVRLLGTAILLSDQRICPVLVEIEVSPNSEGVAAYLVKIGEPGEGPLGISGPPCGSGAATRLLHRLPAREELGRVGWVYEATSREIVA